MLAKFNESDSRRRLLDAAAQILRRRVTPESRFYALVDGTADSAVSPLAEIALPYTERLSKLAEPGQPQIGDMPPQPPTLRGRVGAVLVNVVRRMLFWYTDQIRAQQKRIADAAREQARALHELSAAERRGREALDDVTERLAGQEQLLERQTEVLRNEQRSVADRIDAVRAQTKSLWEAQAATAEENRREHEALAARVEQVEIQARQDLRNLTARLDEQELLIKTLLEAQPHTPELSREIRRWNDHFFVEHARAFRGERDEIKRRLAVYLPFAQKAYAEAGKLPGLDLGCGRGEWLEMLAESGIPARGIDANREFVAGCRERGLDVTEGDLPLALCSVPAESCAIVSAIHVLEHLSFDDLLAVVDHAVRILKPGGIIIFETPNPKNLFVSSSNFYVDPTHHHPLPSEFLAFVIAARGLADIEVLPLMTYPDSARLQETSQAAAFINDNFFAAQDYGVVARRPPPFSEP